MKEKPTALVRCFTYNHAPYIEDAMNGFVNQKTTFPFVCAIVDDASTDGEPEVINRYLYEKFDVLNKNIARKEETDDYIMTFAQSISNPNCYFAVYFLKYNHYRIRKSKLIYLKDWLISTVYHAFCEGDDYWNDNLKLQKQIDFLETHSDYGLVHTDYVEYNQKKNVFLHRERTCFDGDVTRKLISGDFFIAALTTCYRSSIYFAANKDYRKEHFLMGDLPLWIELSRLSKVKFLSDNTSVYRVLENSAAHSTSRLKKAKFQKNLYEVRRYFITKYNYMDLYHKNEKDLYYHKAIVYALQKNLFLAFAAFVKGRHFKLSEIKFFVTRFIVKP